MKTPRPLRIVTTLPHLTEYKDRVLPLIALSQKEEVSLVYLLTVAGQHTEHLSEYPKLKLIECPRRGYLKWISRWLNERLDAGALEVVHDCFGHLSTAFERPAEDRSYVLMTVQYTTNWGWFERVRPFGFKLNARYAYLRAQSLWLDTRVTRAADHVVVLGPGHERDLIVGHGVDPLKISVFPAEIDSDRFYPLAEPSRDFEQTRDPNLLLYTGAISRNKGVDLLLALFDELAKEHPALHLTLIGRVPPFEEEWFRGALSACEARARVTTLEQLPQQELIAYYQRARLYLFPSLFEGAPRTLREAVACGCVCVASELPGCRGADPEGHFIYFAPPRALKEWIKQVRSALAEPPHLRMRRVLMGLEHMRTVHSPQAVAERYFLLYQRLLTELYERKA